jgi:hypothetical protein
LDAAAKAHHPMLGFMREWRATLGTPLKELMLGAFAWRETS